MVFLASPEKEQQRLESRSFYGAIVSYLQRPEPEQHAGLEPEPFEQASESARGPAGFSVGAGLERNGPCPD